MSRFLKLLGWFLVGFLSAVGAAFLFLIYNIKNVGH